MTRTRRPHRPKLTEREAVDQLREAGYEPLEPYPGQRGAPWPAQCLTCGGHRHVTLNNLATGRRCTHRRSATLDQAATEMRAAGYEPLEPYPGTVRARWQVECTDCGRPKARTLNEIRRGRRCTCRTQRT